MNTRLRLLHNLNTPKNRGIGRKPLDRTRECSTRQPRLKGTRVVVKSCLDWADGFLAQRRLFIDHRKSIQGTHKGRSSILNGSRNSVGHGQRRVNRRKNIVDIDLFHMKLGRRITVRGDGLATDKRDGKKCEGRYKKGFNEHIILVIKNTLLLESNFTTQSL